MVRPDKVAVVEEIGEKLSSSTAAVLTEYRGLSVPDLAELRAALRDAGTQYKVYKNTLARRAVEGEHDELIELLEGPVAWAFIDGDVVTAAKAIRDFSKDNDNLVVKGGLLDGAFISADQVDELAQLPTRDELLGKLANGFQAPLRRAAGLFSALQRNTAYAVKALIDKKVEAGEEAPPEEGEEPAETDAAPAEDTGDEAGEGTDDTEAAADDSEAEAEETSAVKSAEESGAENGGEESATSEDSEDDSDAAEASDESTDDAEAPPGDESDAGASQPEDEEASEGDDDQTDKS